MHRLLLAAAIALVGPVFAQDAAKPPKREITLNGHTFTLPDGFEIELVASPPLVDRPISAAFDEQGRLYVSDSSGSNDKVEKQLEDKPHRIVRLADTDGDGRFDESIVFADRMMFPEGTMWFDGSLYVAAAPSIWKLTDTDGDGVADQREQWFQGKTLGHCANDLHGPYLGPDGWIYWCKGAFAKQTYERVGKSLRVIPGTKPDESPAGIETWSTRASHIFRCRPDGSGLEVVMTGGMDNPVDVVFTPSGERIFSTTFLVHPGGGLRDGLLHAVYGGVYGKAWDVIDDHKRTGDVMPVLTHHGASASCGLHRYESRGFGPEFENNLFACLFNMHKVTRHMLEPDGATFTTRDEDFLVSSNLDFHPTDVVEDADGSLIVVDTGGWYKLCCPTSQLHKPDILGALYRIRRKDAPRINDPRGLKLAWLKLTPKELAGLLSDSRPAVRNRAIRELSKYGKDAVGTLSDILLAEQYHKRGAPVKQPSAAVRLNAVWALTRIDDPFARNRVLVALEDPDETVRQAAINSVSLWRDRHAVQALLKLLVSGVAQHQRAAAEALGRIGEPSSAIAILWAIEQGDAKVVKSTKTSDGQNPPSASGSVTAFAQPAGTGAAPRDQVLEHSLIYALIEIADAKRTVHGLEGSSPWTRRAALIALSEMDGGGLEAESVAPLLSSGDPVIKETASWIVSRHADWGGTLAGHLRKRLAANELSDADRTELQQQLARFAKNAAVQDLLAATLQEPSVSPAARRVALAAMRDSGLKEKELPAAWIGLLVGVLSDDDAETVHAAVSAARALPVPKERHAELAAALRKVGLKSGVPADVRLDALAAVPGGLASVEPDLLDLLRTHLTPDSPVSTRSAAADVLSKAKLSTGQLDALTESFKTAGPMELDRLLAPFEQSADEAVGLRLVAALKASPVRGALRADALQRSLAKCGPAVHDAAKELYTAINVDVAKQKERLEELLASTKDGDVRRGQAVFNSSKAACSACHAIGYLGGKNGPDLTRIGQIRNERDLLESIVFPSASLVRSYEPVVVGTREGKVYSGLVRKDAADELILVTSATEEARIAREDIEEIRPGSVSIMPAGLDQQLTLQDLADLVAFLKACK